MSRIYVVGTADTKGVELAFLADEIRRRGGAPLTVDVGTRAPRSPPIFPQETSRHSVSPQSSRPTTVASQ